MNAANRPVAGWPRELGQGLCWGLIAAVLLLHGAVAAWVAWTSVHQAEPVDVALISASLLVASPSGEVTPLVHTASAASKQAPVRPAATWPAPPSPPPALPTPASPMAVAAQAPAHADDFVAPVANKDTAPTPARQPEAALAQTPAQTSTLAHAQGAAVAPPQSGDKAQADAGSGGSELPVPVAYSEVRYRYKFDPPYPAQSKNLGEEGHVKVSTTIDEQGVPVKVAIAQSSGYRRLDAAALDAVKLYRFEPKKINGVPRSVVVPVPVDFNLKNE